MIIKIIKKLTKFGNTEKVSGNSSENKLKSEFDELMQEKNKEIIELKKKLEKIENELTNQNELLVSKEEELTGYINKIFEQQERERIVKWIVDSIRESLELNKVLATIVKEIGKLLKVDRCLILSFNPEKSVFNLQNEYRVSEDVPSLLNDQWIVNLPDNWQKTLLLDNLPIVVNDIEKADLNDTQKLHLQFYNIKSLAIAPVIHKGEILGVIIVHQAQYQRDWGTSHIEILKDIASQIAIAIRQASLYTQVQETTRLKSEFLASMSHEFRTPLNAIIGFSEMLTTRNYGKLTAKQSEYLNNISISGRHLLRLVNDVLDLSKVESGNMELVYEKFNLRDVINETVSILSTMAAKKNINIDLNVNEILLNADSKRFRQIIYNLLSNAIKFTEDNGKVSIYTEVFNDKLKVEIQDTGIGISKQDREKVFSQFRQVDSSYARKQEGTGLGLTLTKKLVEMHKGYIDFESEEGNGSKFWFILPGVEILKANKIS